jgi:pimeloyl-ACP methyl ester carboxylesterase
MDVHPAALVLESTFTSLPDVAGRVAWMYPVQWMMPDRFDTAARAGSLDLPVLLLHGTQDALIPVDHARTNVQLFPDADLVEVTAGHGETLTMLDASARRAYIGLLTRVSSRSGGVEDDVPAP